MKIRIRYLSDLHLEIHGYPATLPSVGEDLVVLAGDIATGRNGALWAQRAIPDRPVIYVAGNHEFYGQDFELLVTELRLLCANSNVHFFECDSLDIAGIRVLGCTLWTDFQVFSRARTAKAMIEAHATMADYIEIRHRGRRLVPRDTVQRCAQSLTWLDQAITQAAEPLLVVTHHAPSLLTLNPNFAGDLSNGAFHNAFDHLLRPPVAAWIHGHTHFSTQKQIGGTALVTNQRGYPREYVGTFDWARMIELEVSP